jgi:uncharacterized iron-regulated membrane protein
MRRVLLWLHLIAGLAAALVLIALGGSGALLVFEEQIDHRINARLWRVEPREQQLSLTALAAQLEKAHPGMKVGNISLPPDEDLAFRFMLRPKPPGHDLNLAVDPYTGAELGSLDTANPFTRQLHQFHTNLLLGPTGKLITSWGAGLLLVLAVTGLILWWPRKVWRWPRAASGRQLNFDLHLWLGFYSSVFMLIFGVTGLIVHSDGKLRTLVDRWAGAPPLPPPPAVSPAPAGAAPLNPDRAVGIAMRAADGARVTVVSGLGGLRNPIRVSMRFPEDRTPAGRTNILLHPVTGEVLSAELSRTGSPGLRIVKLWNREVHTGDIFGWPTKILASLASLSLPLLAVTGPLIALGNLRRKLRRKASPRGAGQAVQIDDAV